MEELQGIVFEIVYRNDENGYTVANLETEKNIVTITGFFSSSVKNENLHMYGTYTNHPKYGIQFKVENYNIILPTEISSIEAYLGSGLIKGIGPSFAKRIVEVFGEDTFTIIQHNPERLMEIDGIGEKKAKSIAESFVSQLDIKDIMIFLQNHGISSTFAVKIYKEYGNDTIEIIKENPYRLAEDIYGIGFKIADSIASSIGVQADSSFRIRAGIQYILMEAASKGHCYLPYENLIHSVSQLLNINTEIISIQTRELAFNGNVFIESINSIQCVYYLPYYTAETYVASKLISLANYKFLTNEDEIYSLLDYKYGSENPIQLTDLQRSSVLTAISNGVTIITGGPGTGKTTLIRAVIDILENMEKKVLLCAPTGRAAKRITESTSREAKTIHRLLEYTYGEDDTKLSFNKNEKSPLEADAIIIDEVSMIDIILMQNLLKAIISGTRVIFVGDADQLPSVGAGNVLRDIINSGIIKTIKLDKIFRQMHGSAIINNAHKINSGQVPTYNEKDSDFFLMRENNDKNILNIIVDLYSTRLPKKYNLNPIKDIQVLSPMKKGDVGVLELNNKLQNIINPPSKLKLEKKFGNTIFRVGDKVMQIKNNYKLEWVITDKDGNKLNGEGIYNGDIGYITFIDDKEHLVYVEFDDGKEVTYDYSALDELILSYASTVHKSQGSEFPVIIMPMTWAPEMLLTRNLLYTAITRAKQLVVLVGQDKYVELMIKNNKIDNRFSALDLRLKAMTELLGGI